jgi:hypothetical protein
MIFAGFVFTSSETGCDARTITPRLAAQARGNGMTITADAKRGIHLGERREEGMRRNWPAGTGSKTLPLLTAKVRDTVQAILAPRYAGRAVRETERQAGYPVADPVQAIRTVSRLRCTRGQHDEILARFIEGAAVTAGGIMHAVTSTAQTQPDGDAAYQMKSTALQALGLAVSL